MRSSLFMNILALLGVTLASGCASITGTTNQSVSIQTVEREGRELPGAQCELTNSKGKWFVTTPGSTMITRSNDDMQVTCNKAGFDAGRASVVSAIKGSMFGNIIFGGGIGAIVDHNTGAAYEYPTFFQVLMGAFTKIEPPTEGGAPPAGSTAAATPGSPAPSQWSSPAPMPVSTTVNAPSGSVDEKLKDLKRLHESGLISKEVYMDEQRKVMESRTVK